MNPQTAAAEQAAPAIDPSWEATFKSLMGLDDPSGEARRKFAAQPRSNRFDTILEAVVPSRRDPTHEKVLALVNALVENGAVRADEAGQMYDALLQRVSRYNSTNVQTNLDRMVRDVREAVSARTRQEDRPTLASLVALNAFLATLPATVQRGQQDYLAFVAALRLLVSEVPQLEVYQAGPDYYLQTSRGGLQTVNLTRAFDNLQPLWGVTGAESGNVSSLLTPNSRLLLLLVAPFTDAVGLNRDSYLGHLLTLYRETLSQVRPDEQTYREITDVSRSGLGEQDSENLRATLNFLVANRERRTPAVYALSVQEERVLRYIQQAISIYMTHRGVNATDAIDQVAANLEPSFYHRNRAFVDRLLDYLRRAAGTNANYFHSIVMNPQWQPPAGFFSGNFDIPDDTGPLQDFAWDDTWDRWNRYRDASGYSSGLMSTWPPGTPNGAAAANSSGVPSISGVSGVLSAANGDGSLSSLVNALENVRTSRSEQQQQQQQVLAAAQPLAAEEQAQAHDLSGTGRQPNPFAHLRPRGRSFKFL